MDQATYDDKVKRHAEFFKALLVRLLKEARS